MPQTTSSETLSQDSLRLKYKQSNLEKAGNIETPSEWLSGACGFNDPELLAILARNPNTPKEKLFRLWAKFPEAIFENPVLMLWEFTSPQSLTKDVPQEVLFSIYHAFLQRPDFEVPDYLISVKWRVKFLLDFYHSGLIPLHRFATDRNQEVRLTLIEELLPKQFEKHGSVRFPISSVENLLRNASDRLCLAVARAVAEKWLILEKNAPEIMENLARQLFFAHIYGMDEYLSRWENLPMEVIDQMSVSAKPSILVNLISRSNCSRQFYEKYAVDDFPDVRAAVARCTPFTDMHEWFMKDPSFEVRAGLASSAYISDEHQRCLVSPKNAHIHQALLRNPRTLPEVLAFLADIPNTGMAHQILAHPNLTVDVVDKLMEIKERIGFSHAPLAARPDLLTPELFARHRQNFEQCVLLAYVNAPHTPVHILAELACHPDREIHKAIDNLLCHRPHRSSVTSDIDAIAIIEAVLNHPDTTANHRLLKSRRMSSAQALRIFENSTWDRKLRFTSVLERLRICHHQRRFAEYADLYRKISAPLEAMVGEMATGDLAVLSRQIETPANIREILKNHPDNEVRSSNSEKSRTIRLSAMIDAFPEAFPENGDICLRASPQEILEKLAISSHSLLAEYAAWCLSEPFELWAKKLPDYPRPKG